MQVIELDPNEPLDTGVVELSGDELASHIKRVEKRIDVITCLAKEAAGQKP